MRFEVIDAKDAPKTITMADMHRHIEAMDGYREALLASWKGKWDTALMRRRGLR